MRVTLQPFDVSGAETQSAHDDEDDMTTMRIGVVAIALSMAAGLVLDAGSTQPPGKDRNLSGTTGSSKRMADGKEWTTSNLNVNTPSSYCYEDAESNCRRYGRLYTWESAQRGCQSLGGGWRLPTDDEWRQLATRYGGLVDDSPDKGKAAFTALLSGGTSGFNAVFAGTRSAAGQYNGWRHTESTGRHRSPIRTAHRSITSARAVRESLVTSKAGSRWHFPSGASAHDGSTAGPAKCASSWNTFGGQIAVSPVKSPSRQTIFSTLHTSALRQPPSQA